MIAADIEPFRSLVGADHGLAVISVVTGDGGIHSSVANAGVLDLPGRATPVVGLVVGGNTRKLRLLREHGRASVTLRGGWQWASIEGPIELVGPDDPHPDYDQEQVRLLLREVFSAAGGEHDDWDTYDRVMAEERRTAVLVSPAHVYGIR